MEMLVLAKILQPHLSLDVNGNVNATKFFGNGSELSDVQLNAIQNNAVTFNATVELNDVLKLNPSNSDPCDADSAGSLYTKNEMLNGTNVSHYVFVQEIILVQLFHPLGLRVNSRIVCLFMTELWQAVLCR